MTDAYAGYGKDNVNSAQLAVEEANARKVGFAGKPIRFQWVSADDQGAPRVAVQVAQRLVDEKVAAVVGHFNIGAALPASRVYAKAGLPIFACRRIPSSHKVGARDHC
jgi:branched-chain amino acid transport system substrate-binding protein